MGKLWPTRNNTMSNGTNCSDIGCTVRQPVHRGNEDSLAEMGNTRGNKTQVKPIRTVTEVGNWSTDRT